MAFQHAASGPEIVMPVLFRGENVVVRGLQPSSVPVTIIGPNFSVSHEVHRSESADLVVWNTGDHPDGSYVVRLELPGGVLDLRFEITRDLYRQSRRQFGRPLIIAHRGGRTYAPENTLAAFSAAFEHGADACEMDVRLTHDDELVIMHDETLERTTGGSGPVAELTLSHIKKLRVAGEPVPTLREVFDAFGPPAMFQIHVKLQGEVSRDGRLLSKLASAIAEYGCEDRCTILCSKPQALAVLRYNSQLRVDLDIGALSAKQALGEYGLLWFAGSGHRLKTSDFHLSSSAAVRDAHSHGLPLVCWARDSSDWNVERVIRLGVDAVMTDYPERMGAIADKVDVLATPMGPVSDSRD